MKATLGLIVNPVAGMGGRVALKGTDGSAVLCQAVARGAVPTSPLRAGEALQQLAPVADGLELLAWCDQMGAQEARRAGLTCRVLRPGRSRPTSSTDTRAAARAMVDRGLSLLLFAGGDGTARDIFESIGTSAPVLGIPAGVKMHSAVFAISPRSAGRVARRVLEAGRTELSRADVMDVDEAQLRSGTLAPRLHGVLHVPAAPRALQSAKARGELRDAQACADIAAHVLAEIDDDTLLIVGPGSTTAAILERLGLEPTLLGIDVVRGGELIARDADEGRLLGLVAGASRSRVVLAPVGGQGFILGRGNQQISPAVLRGIGPENLLLVATEAKLAGLAGRPLLVDSGDAELDQQLAGHVRVVVGRRRSVVYHVEGA